MTTESMTTGGAGEPLRRFDTDLGSGGLAAGGSTSGDGSFPAPGPGGDGPSTSPKPLKPKRSGRRGRRKWLRYLLVPVLVALIAALASAGSVYWEFSKIPTFKMPKDQGVDAGSIRPPSDFPDVDPAANPTVDPAVDPAVDPGASDPSDGSGPETVEGLPSAMPAADAPNAPGTNRPSGADVANAQQNIVDPSDIGPDGYFGDAATKNYLIVGLDDRSGIAAEQSVEFGVDEPGTAGVHVPTRFWCCASMPRVAVRG
jgi:hypothetical protein